MGSTNITIEDIKKIFQDMFQQHQEAITKKQEEMFRSHENSIMQLISGNTTLKIRDLTISVKKLKIWKKAWNLHQKKPKKKLAN